MKRNLLTVKEVLSGYSQGLSLDKIQKATGVPKTSAKRIIDLAKLSDQPIDRLLGLADDDLEAMFIPLRRTRMNYVEPDWESVFLAHEKPRRAIQLRVCWEQYCRRAINEGKAMGYSTFCRAYEAYKSNLPASMHDVSMAFEWEPGKVAMIDYSGDPLYYVARDGKRHKAEIFVGVMAYSNMIYCVATPDQSRQSWLMACKAMLEYFGAVPEYIFLDNSTSLVIKADLYVPKYCADFIGFAGYYGFTPMATRPGKPRDKAAVEGAVGIVQRRITNVLSSSQFLSLDDVNNAIRPLLEELNDRPLSEKSATRRQLHEEEKPVMLPLPELAYELGLIEKILKVSRQYQIRLHNRRFSVPYRYAGKLVKVRLWGQQNLVIAYDIKTGKEITRHHYDDSNGNKARVLLEHMPPNHVAQLKTKNELLESLRAISPCSYELGLKLTRNQSELTARRMINGLLAVARNAGAQIAQEVAAATLKRPNPTYEAYRDELDRRTGDNTVDIHLGKGVKMAVVQSNKNLRGPGYYAKYIRKGLSKKTGEAEE